MEEQTLGQNIELLLKRAPAPVRSFILNDLSGTTQVLMEKYRLHVDQGDVLQTELLLTLVGETTPEEFLAALEEAGVPGEVLAPLLTDVNEQIFKKIRAEESSSTVAPVQQGMVAQMPPVESRPVPPIATPTPPPTPPVATTPAPVVHTPPVKPSATAAFEHPAPTPPRFPGTPSIPTPTLRPLSPIAPSVAPAVESLTPIHYAAHSPAPAPTPHVVAPAPTTPTMPASVAPAPTAPASVVPAAPPSHTAPAPVAPKAQEANTFTPLSSPSVPSNTKGHAPTLEGATIRTMAKDMEAAHDHKPAEPVPYHFEPAQMETPTVTAPIFSPHTAGTPSEEHVPWPLPKPAPDTAAAPATRPTPPPPENLPGQPKAQLIKEYGTDPYRESIV